MSNLFIHQEEHGDYEQVFNLIELAFKNEEFSDQKEQFLVDRLRRSTAFVPELSIVAEQKDKIIGHILFTKIMIRNDERSFGSLALAPVSVLPEFQKMGVGGQLIIHGHEIARKLGFKSVVLLGHESYYPRFGYERTSKYNVSLPFDVPDENCMIKELAEGGLEGVSGTVEYASEFSV